MCRADLLVHREHHVEIPMGNWSSEPPPCRLPAHSLAVLAMIGGGPVDARDRLLAPFGRLGSRASRRHVPDGLKPTHVLSVGGLDRVPQGRETRAHEVIKAELQ